MVLFLPDEILVVDHYSAKAWIDRYDFTKGDVTTIGQSEEIAPEPFVHTDTIPPRGDHRPGEYAELVVKAKESFRKGDLFEVVPGQKFMERCDSKPSQISKRLKEINPSPYSFFINLGNQEYLVGASPEMFVRVNGRRIETCPISGTIKRGADPIEDSAQMLRQILDDILDYSRIEAGALPLEPQPVMLRSLLDNVQQLLSQHLCIAYQKPLWLAFGFQGEQCESHVGKFIVDHRPDHAGRQVAGLVADFLAGLVELFLHLRRRSAVEQRRRGRRVHPFPAGGADTRPATALWANVVRRSRAGLEDRNEWLWLHSHDLWASAFVTGPSRSAQR